MTQNFNFKVNIERLNPFTGQLLYVDRMTSDYAQAHPFDVDGYLEQVYQKWAECETVQFRETREALRKVWNAVLGDMNPRGNASLYPNAHGPHPAMMEVWHKAGDFWRRGLRITDTLPALEPMCKITRLQDGSWIALFPKDKHLLEQPTAEQDEHKLDSSGEFVIRQEVISASVMHEESSADDGISNADISCGRIANSTEQVEQVPTPSVAHIEVIAAATEQPKPKRKDRKEKKTSNLKTQTSNQLPRQLDLFGVPVADSVIDDAQDQSDHKVLKAVGILAAGVAVMAILIHTGMLIPMGLIGLAAGGMLR